MFTYFVMFKKESFVMFNDIKFSSQNVLSLKNVLIYQLMCKTTCSLVCDCIVSLCSNDTVLTFLIGVGGKHLSVFSLS